MKKINFLIFTFLLLGSNIYAQYFFRLDVNANYIGYDTKREMVYATINGFDPNFPNSLVAIDPTKGEIVKDVFIGSEPTEFVFTTDTNYLFIMFDEQSVVKKFSIDSFSVVREINLGNHPYHGPFFGKSLAVLPNDNSSVIVSRKVKGVSPNFGGVAVYTDSGKLPWETKDHHGPEFLVNTQNDTLFAYQSDFFTLKIDSDSGIIVLNETDDLGMYRAKLDGGLIIDDAGKIVDPRIPNQKGQFPLDHSLFNIAHVSDAAKNKVYFVEADDYRPNIILSSYDRRTYGKIADYHLTDVISEEIEDPTAEQLIRFEDEGLAMIINESWGFNDPKSMIGILNNADFVDSSAKSDTTGLSSLFVMDTVFTYETVTVHDTVDIFNYITVFDTTYLSTTDTLIVYQTKTNVNGNIINSEISIYPNPTSDYINIDIENNIVIGNYTIRLYNVSGELLYENQLVSDLLTVDISSYAKGTYLLNLSDNYGRRVARKSIILK